MTRLQRGDLVALAMQGGPRFVEELQRAWDAGAAVLPVDPRLPDVARRGLLAALEPTVVVDADATVRLAGRPVDAGDALVVATSGSTGAPKGVVLTHDAVAASATLTSDALGVDPATDHWVACLPLAHIGGLSVVTRALHRGTGLTVLDRPDPAALAAAASAGATLVSLVVATLDRIDPASWRLILLGGSAIPPERPPNSVATYGSTETGSGIVYEGRPLDGVDLTVRDGELLVRSPTLLRAYRDGVDPRTTDGWYPTGDGGTVDPDGRVQVFGRLAEVIVTGGEKVWPAAVEAALRAATPALEVAVVGRPDPTWGQVVTAVVEIPVGGTVPSVAALRDAVAHLLPASAMPRRVEVVDRLPRTANGKVRRADL